MNPEVMAEEPRYKRRKQANPRRKNVLNYEKLVDTKFETEVDEEALVPEDHAPANTEGGRSDEDEKEGGSAGVPTLGALPYVDHTLLSYQDQEASEGDGQNHGWTLGNNDTKSARQLDGVSNLAEFFCKRKVDNGSSHPVTIAEYLQRSDIAVIYPEAPEEMTRLSTPDAISQDESEHNDFTQLLTCPYCDRGYKRLTLLNEHIKYHEKNEESVNCFQLERHMTMTTREQVPSHSEDNGNRKFKCSECGKAFKYKHHLKEHLRIHSGEKPYECSNCKKRFSHSGSYSSHISSKKCMSLIAVNGRICIGNKPGSSPNSPTSSLGRPTLTQLSHKRKNGLLFGPTDQQGQQDIKSEPMDFSEYRLLMDSQHGLGGPAVYFNGCNRSIQSSSHSPLQDLRGMGLELPLLGYTETLGNNLSEVQNVLQIVDNTVCQQKMDWKPEDISRLRAYIKELGAQIENQNVVLGGFHVSTMENIIDNTQEMDSKFKDLTDDAKQVDVKKEKLNHSADLSREENHLLLFSCQFCNQTFPGPIPLHQHECYLCNMNEEIKAVLPPGEDSTTSSEPPGIKQAPCPINCFQDHMSVPKAYFTMNTEPNSEELLGVSSTLGLPQKFVKDWFSQWKSQNHHGGRKTTLFPDLKQSVSQSPLSLPDVESHRHFAESDTLHRRNNSHHFTARQTPDKQPLEPQMDQLRRDMLSPLNLSSTSSKTSQNSFYTPNSLTSEESHGEIPLDLSLPKPTVTQRLMVEKQPRANGFMLEHSTEHGTALKDQSSIKTEVLDCPLAVHQLEKSSSPIFGINPFSGGPMYTSLPSHSAFPPPTFMSPARATVPGLRTFPSLDPMSFLPQMAFTYATGAATFTELQQRRTYRKKPGFQGELLDGTAGVAAAHFLSSLDDLTDSESLLCRKKMKKTESGMYACDLCDKTFQKTSSLLRHKYEHTGKRPHQCQICKKAFKHKHHLIEHSRLHSGEKPYQCDKCGKRFSHSGSYSQHMNHRYSYCKREAEEREAAERKARDKGGGAEGGVVDVVVADMETELLMRTAYLQELVPLRYSDPEEPQDGGRGVNLRNSRKGRGEGDTREEDSKMFEEVTDRPEGSLREGEDESSRRSQMDMMRDKDSEDTLLLVDQSS